MHKHELIVTYILYLYLLYMIYLDIMNTYINRNIL